MEKDIWIDTFDMRIDYNPLFISSREATNIIKVCYGEGARA